MRTGIAGSSPKLNGTGQLSRSAGWAAGKAYGAALGRSRGGAAGLAAAIQAISASSSSTIALARRDMAAIRRPFGPLKGAAGGGPQVDLRAQGGSALLLPSFGRCRAMQCAQVWRVRRGLRRALPCQQVAAVAAAGMIARLFLRHFH